MAHKILAIDDHLETLSILVTTLKSHGYRVVFSQSPFKGLELVESERPDLLLVDMNMPGMNGLEVVRKVRAIPDLSGMPIVMFTAEGDSENKRIGFQVGVDDYILKPTEPAELIERVESLLRDVPDSEPEYGLSEEPEAAEVWAGDGDGGDLGNSGNGGEGRLIVLVGRRGGVGTTTVAINLAYMMAQLKRPTVLADFDFQQGHIGLYLNLKATQSINEVADVGTGFLGNSLEEQFVQYGDFLQLLLARPNLNGRYPVPSANQVATVLELMLKREGCVIADLGLGATAVTRPLLDRADDVVVCLAPERIALAAARRYLEELQRSIFFDTRLHVLMCDMSMSASLPRQAIERYLERPLLGVLSFPRQELIQASNKGVPLAKAFPESALMAELLKMANDLMPVDR